MNVQKISGRFVDAKRERYATVIVDTSTGLILDVMPFDGIQTFPGCLIFTGFGDIHVHCREDVSGQQNYKEDYETASAAAIHGGVTFIADMPNNPVAPTNYERYAEKEKLTAKSKVHVTLYAGIGPGTKPLVRMVPYKAYMGHSVGDLFFNSFDVMEDTLQHYDSENVSVHCDDQEILDMFARARTHERRRPAESEMSAIDFALTLAEKYDLTLKLCHCSICGGLPKVIAARKKGIKVTCEVTPHHLFFDEEMLTDENRLWLQMNPPLRTRIDRHALIMALRNGVIDYLATDHAPHTIEEKGKGISGVPLLDTYGAFVTWLMREHQFSPSDIARICSRNPATFINEFLPSRMGNGFGEINIGYVGSFTVINPNKPVTIKRSMIKSKCGWSPFEGITFPGSVVATIIAGDIHIINN